MQSNHPSDRELVSNYLNGKEACLQTLVLRHKLRLFGFIKKKVKDHQLAEDIFQDL